MTAVVAVVLDRTNGQNHLGRYQPLGREHRQKGLERRLGADGLAKGPLARDPLYMLGDAEAQMAPEEDIASSVPIAADGPRAEAS